MKKLLDGSRDRDYLRWSDIRGLGFAVVQSKEGDEIVKINLSQAVAGCRLWITMAAAWGRNPSRSNLDRRESKILGIRVNENKTLEENFFAKWFGVDFLLNENEGWFFLGQGNRHCVPIWADRYPFGIWKYSRLRAAVRCPFGHFPIRAGLLGWPDWALG